MSVININLFSMMLRRTIDVTVVLPDKINDGEKLPCVWLYHAEAVTIPNGSITLLWWILLTNAILRLFCQKYLNPALSI